MPQAAPYWPIVCASDVMCAMCQTIFIVADTPTSIIDIRKQITDHRMSCPGSDATP